MNPSAVARAGTTSAPMTKCGAVYAIAIKMDTILDMSQISNRFVRNGRKTMISGSMLVDAVGIVAIGWCIAFIMLPIGQWIDYKRDCKKHGKETTDEIRRSEKDGR